VVGAVVLRVADLLAQLAMIGLGLTLVFVEDEVGTLMVDLLALWCLIAGAYWLASVIAVGVTVRRPEAAWPGWLQKVDRHPAVAVIMTTATFVNSIVGVVAAATMLVLRNDPEWAGWVEPVAIVAMLLAWALFHWGFARIYDRRYRRADAPPLLFPGTTSPRLADFVYFSFTNATNFSVSDVQVMTTRMRWTVVWHTTLSFFLNALIIVLAFSTIINS
jgi:uncharacterized membrane protein